MCILFFAYDPLGTGKYVLIAANNRDESYTRETLPAAFWDDHPHILAGNCIFFLPYQRDYKRHA